MTAASGLVVVDKPAGLTSHTVVSRIRRLAGTRRVGHAGTLDPAATGVLLVGVERATRLLGYLAATDKTYTATVRLGQSTVSDDAESPVTGGASAAGVQEADVRAAIGFLTGSISQVPSSVSAVKVGGQRAYARVRAGEDVRLEPREVVVAEFDLVSQGRPTPELLDFDIRVTCSSGTYVRALARDLGSALGVGGHLTALRRTRVGAFGEEDARTLDALAETFELHPLADVVAAGFPTVVLDPESATDVRHGRRVTIDSATETGGPVGVFDSGGAVLALMEASGGELRPLVVFDPA